MKGFSLASKPRVSFVFNPFRPMGFSIKLHAIKTGWFIVYIEGSQVIISRKIHIAFLSSLKIDLVLSDQCRP